MDKYNFIKVFFHSLLLTGCSTCDCKYTGGEEYGRFNLEEIRTEKLPFSGIGLVRENPMDTIEIWYANATEEEGINEIKNIKFARDTVVGLTESWMKIEYGVEFCSKSMGFHHPVDYTEKGENYFKICNRGKSDLKYFIFSPDSFFPSNPFMKYNKKRYIYYLTKRKKIKDILYNEDGVLQTSKLKEVYDIYNSNSISKNELFDVNDEDIEDEIFYEDNNITIGYSENAFSGVIKSKTCISNNARIAINRWLVTGSPDKI